MVQDHEDGANRFGRWKRHGRLVGTGARLVWRHLLAGDLASPEGARIVRSAFGDLKGPAMKTVQILASLPGVLPPHLARALAELQTQAPPMGPAFVRRRMRAELGPDWRGRFADFELRPRFAASLGQVHRAVLHDGRVVALKLQYPAMAEAIDADLAELRLVLGLLAPGAGIKADAVLAELRMRLAEELDYRGEAANMRFFSRAFERLSMAEEVRVPQALADLTTDRLLAMEWMAGRPLLEAAKAAPQELRDRMGALLFSAWYRPFFSLGLLHGDPHPGNYRWEAIRRALPNGSGDGDGRLILLDYGCVRWFSPDFVVAVGDLWRALKVGADDAILAGILENWGFGALSKRQVAALRPWLDLLFEPLLDDRVRPLSPEGGMAARGFEALRRVRAELRAAGEVHPPGEFVLLHRSAILLGAVLEGIGARANWSRLFAEMVAGIERGTISVMQDEVATAAARCGQDTHRLVRR